MPVKYICGECGSDNIVIDAYALWDTAEQDWVLSSTHEFCVCNDCGREEDTEEVEITDVADMMQIVLAREQTRAQHAGPKLVELVRELLEYRSTTLHPDDQAALQAVVDEVINGDVK